MADTGNRIKETLIDPNLVTDLKRLEFSTRRILGADLMGQYRSAFRGSGLVYSDLREYQPGDEVKNIHWKATARSGKVYVKSYDEDRLLNVTLLVDISNSTRYGSPRTRHQRAFEFAALIAMLAQKNEDALGLCLFSQEIEEFMRPRRSRTQFQKVILSLLGHRDLKPASNLPLALKYLQRHLRRAGIIFVVSDFYTAPYREELRELSYRHDVILVQLEDSVEQELPHAGLVEFVDAESGRAILLDSSSTAVRHNFDLARKQHKEEIMQAVNYAKADYLALNGNPLPALSMLMKRRTTHVFRHAKGIQG